MAQVMARETDGRPNLKNTRRAKVLDE